VIENKEERKKKRENEAIEAGDCGSITLITNEKAWSSGNRTNPTIKPLVFRELRLGWSLQSENCALSLPPLECR
jgi:hypothetical protein